MRNVQVIRDGEAVKLTGFFQSVCGDGVGNIEREVSDFDEFAIVTVVIEGG